MRLLRSARNVSLQSSLSCVDFLKCVFRICRTSVVAERLCQLFLRVPVSQTLYKKSRTKNKLLRIDDYIEAPVIPVIAEFI